MQIGDNTCKELLEKAIKISPLEITAREGLMHLELKTGFFNKAYKSAEALEREHGASFSTSQVFANIAERNGWNPEASLYYAAALNSLYGSGWLYARRAAVAGSLAEAIEILQNGRKRVFDVDLAEALGSWLYQSTEFEAAEKVYRNLLRLEKYSENYWDALSSCLVARGEYATAVSVLQDGLEWMPQSPFLRDKIGRLLLREGKQEAGLSYLEEASAIQSDNPEIAAYIAELSSEDKDFYAGQELDYALLAGKDIAAHDYPQFDRVCLLDQHYVVVTENGAVKEMVRRVTKVLRESGVAEASVEGIFYDSSRQKVDIKHARVIQPSGEISANPVIEDGRYNTGYDQGGIYGAAQIKSIKLNNVKEGSIVDIMYTIEDTDANIYHDEFSDICYTGDIEPTLKFIYTVQVPTKMQAKYYVYNTTQKAEYRDLENGQVEIKLELENIPGVEVEPLMPPVVEIKPFIVVSTFKGWQDLARWADGLFAPAIILPDDIVAKVEALVAGAKTREEKIAAIYNYVTKNIRYVSISYGRFGYAPHKAERTYRSGYGDCKDTAVLLSAMLRAVGIEAYPTLIRTRDNGKLPEKLASPEFFNHSIAYVPATKDSPKHYWLDGTTDFFLLGMIPAMDRGTESLIIKDGGGLVEVDKLEPGQEMQTSEFNLNLKHDGSGRVSGREIYHGRSWANMKQVFEKPEAFFNMLRGFFNQRFAEIKIEKLDYKLEDNKSVGWFEYAISSQKIAQTDGNSLKLLPWVFPLNIEGIAVLKERKYDLVVGSPQIFEVVANIELEDGLEPMAELPDVDEEIEAIAYKRSFTRTATGIKVVTKIILKKSLVKQESYAEFRDFINMIMARTREWLFLK